MVKIFVYGPWGRLPFYVNDYDDLLNQIKTKYKIKHCLLYNDHKNTQLLKPSNVLQDNDRIYCVSDPIKAEEIKSSNPTSLNHHETITTIPKLNSQKEKYLSYIDYKNYLDNEGKKEDIFDYKKNICKEHPINVTCMKCLNTVITLKMQIYRHIDYVEFDTKFYVETFITEWKNTQKQKIGLLIGTFKTIDRKERAIVHGIYYPDQQQYPDGIHLNNIINFPFTDLNIVGIIYTDLFLKDNVQYSYKVENNITLSAYELEFFYKISQVLNQKKLVFICITPNAKMNIQLNCYLLTEQFYSIMEANLLKLTTDPSTFIVEVERDIVYMYKNEYNLDVSKKADPFVPLEYFFVTCEAGYSTNTPLFNNYSLSKKLLTLEDISSYFDGEYHDFFKYHNLFILLSINNIFSNTSQLFKAVIKNDKNLFYKILNSEEFLQFIALLEEHKQIKWNCNACTYLNEGYATQCDMCGTPKINE